jgi:hypothetical protein
MVGERLGIAISAAYHGQRIDNRDCRCQHFRSFGADHKARARAHRRGDPPNHVGMGDPVPNTATTAQSGTSSASSGGEHMVLNLQRSTASWGVGPGIAFTNGAIDEWRHKL